VMEFWKMLPDAWWAILACFDEDKVRSMEFIQQDMWASIQNLLLAAHEKNIWSVWLGLYPHKIEMEKIAQHFDLPQNIIPFAIISLWKKNWEIPEKILKDDWKIEIL
jgi:nitroreductase